jgi:septal ring-binding cell division protein DamX
LFNLNETGTDKNGTMQKVDDLNNMNETIFDLNSTENNSTNMLIGDTNTTILDYIEKPLPEELGMVVVDNNQSNDVVIIIDENNTQSSSDSNATINTITPASIALDKPRQKELSGFAKIFMESNPKNDYTINLAVAYTKEQSDKFINENNLKENTFAIGFLNDTDNKYYVKIMYGIYKTKAEALEAVKKFPSELKVNKPTVESVYKKQSLFNKKGDDLSVK